MLPKETSDAITALLGGWFGVSAATVAALLALLGILRAVWPLISAAVRRFEGYVGKVRAENMSERQILSADEQTFRKLMLDNTKDLRDQIKDLLVQLTEARRETADCERERDKDRERIFSLERQVRVLMPLGNDDGSV